MNPINATILSAADLTEIDGEPRIGDLILARSLGFDRPRNIRKLIERNAEALSVFGEVCSTWSEPTAAGGRPGRAYHLNRKQALFLTAKSDTERAAFLTIAMVEVFDAWIEQRQTPAPITEDLPWWHQPVYGEQPQIIPSVVRLSGHLIAVDLHNMPGPGDWAVIAIERNVFADGAESGSILARVRDIRIARIDGLDHADRTGRSRWCSFIHLPGEAMERGQPGRALVIGRIVPPELIGAEHAGPLLEKGAA